MDRDPKRPPAHGGLLVPGESPKPTPGGIVGPGAGESVSPGGIVLPPGADDAPDDLPEYPRLRPLEAQVIQAEGQELLLLADPLGVVPQPVALSRGALPLLQLLDGTVSLNDACAALVRESGDLNASRMFRGFVGQLDRLLLLDSDRFRQARDELQREYHALEFRQAALAGAAYPDSAEALGKLIDRHFTRAEAWRDEAGEPAAATGALPRALVAPHIDLNRGGPAIARAYLEVGAQASAGSRFVLIGTGHQLIERHWALTRKHFETPFGAARCDTAFVDALAARLGDGAYAGELAHRDEHSLEFQALYLKRRLGDRPFSIVPILFGGFHGLAEEGLRPGDVPEIAALVSALREVTKERGGPTCFVAAVDLSHVGARFGDEFALDDARLKDVERADREAVEAARGGSADAWFDAIAAHQDSTRICGYGPLDLMLRVLDPGEGRLLRYEQSLEASGSVVSFAAMVWA